MWRKNGDIVQNSTSVRYRLTITDKENDSNYSCEVNAHGMRDQKKISLVIESKFVELYFWLKRRSILIVILSGTLKITEQLLSFKLD